jgi:hypothetical protein
MGSLFTDPRDPSHTLALFLVQVSVVVVTVLLVAAAACGRCAVLCCAAAFRLQYV